MKKVVFFCLPVLLGCLCVQASAEQHHEGMAGNVVLQQSVPSVATLFKKANGKYPYEMKMFSSPSLKKRLLSLMGKKNYSYLINTCTIETPVDYYSGYYLTFNGMPHSVPCDNVRIAYCPDNDNLTIMVTRDNVSVFFQEKQDNKAIKILKDS